MSKYISWETVDKIPKGWSIDKTCGSPVSRTVFITNGKSPLNGQKRMLLRVHPKPLLQSFDSKLQAKKPEEPTKEIVPFPAKKISNLARAKMREKILKDVLFDLQVCELEGWCKTEYINSIVSDLLSASDYKT